MARKEKDLFVLLKERMGKGRGKSGRGAAKKSGKQARVGSGLGDWFRSVLKITQPEQGTGRASAPAQVPRGLLVPGWLPIVLVLLGLGTGFLIGRWTSDGAPNQVLSVGGKGGDEGRGGKNKLGAFPGGQQRGGEQGARLGTKKAEERLSNYFVAVLEFAASQRDRADRLAQYLRENGLQDSRIQRVKNERGDVVWMTICYIEKHPDGGVPYSLAQAKRVLARLRKIPEPDFAPEFASAVQKLGSAELVVLEFQ